MASGVIVDLVTVGYQMEQQTRPIFTSANGLSALAHELAHQWFGDHVAIQRMRDVWLSEGFATFANWLWVENTGGTTAQAAFNNQWARAANTTFWNNTVHDPGVTNQYQSATVYQRGAMTLQALRNKIGDEAFFNTLKAYVSTFGGGTAGHDDFVAIAQRESGQDLRDFFKVWLYTPGKPSDVVLLLPRRRRPGHRHRRRAGDARADARRTGDVRLVHARRRAGLHGEHDRHRDLERRRRHALDRRPERVSKGHLVNGAFALPSALQARATGAFADVGTSPTLLTWNGPVSNQSVPLEFKQSIGAADALRTGTYSKLLTLTLSTTTP